MTVREAWRMLLAVVLALGVVVAVPTSGFAADAFDDVPNDHPFHDEITWLADQGLTTGYPDGTFRPGAAITRQAVVAFLHRMAGAPGSAASSPFPDVTAEHPFHDAIAWAHDHGIVDGYADGTFRPDATLTRQAAAALLFRSVGAPAGAWDATFEDVSEAHPFHRAITWMADRGVTQGWGDGTFGPDVPATRQAVAAFLHRLEPVRSEPMRALVGAGVRSVMPRVDGAREYLDPAGLPTVEEATDVGVFVPEWDVGRIAVGNGHEDGHWVHDDLQVRAVAIEDPLTEDIVALVATDLYMIFRPDVEEIRRRALAQLDEDVAARTDISVTTTHNHHGPDTAWDVNHAWFDHMMDQVADAIVEAIETRRPATLRVGAGEHWFGMADTRDPHVIDPSMNVLQATGLDGEVIATAVQWNNHPEVTLSWTPPGDRSEDCEQLAQPDDCTLRHRFFTADYPGHLRDTIEEEVGGTAVYFIGALGGLIAPLRVPLWEVTEEHGLGDQHTVPEGAVPAGHPEIESFTEGNFRRAYLIGREAGLAALDALEDGEDIAGPLGLSHQTREIYTRMSNVGFRSLLVIDDEVGHSWLGHSDRMMYTCPPQGPKTAETCVADDFAVTEDPQAGPIRVGDHGASEVGYVTLGPIGMVLMPGEVVGELVIGLPDGWDERPEDWFGEDMALHATGEDYDTPGYVHAQIPDRYAWTIGSANDHLGYVVPISDWRIGCVADAVAGEGACQQLYEAGAIEYPDGVAGETCKAITEDPSRLQDYPEQAAEGVAASCRYGQALARAEDHYEETMSAGWDLAEDLLAAVKALTGADSDQRINPDFPGYWHQMPPPIG